MTSIRSEALHRGFAILSGLILLATPAFAQVTEEWVVRFDGAATGEDRANAVAVDAQGNVYVTGQGGIDGTDVDYATIKYNAQGVQQWLATYNGPANGNDIAGGIVVDEGGNVYVTGSSIGLNSSDEDYATVKYDPNGNQQWAARYNGPGNALDEPFDITVDVLGNVYVTGRSNRTGGHFEGLDYLTIKYNSAGVEQWVVRFNGTGNDWDQANSIEVDELGNVYVTGHSGFEAGTAFQDYRTFKYNSSGNVVWFASFNGSGNNWDEAVDLELDDDGNVYVTGLSSGSASSWDYATVKYNNAGIQQWATVFNGPVGEFDFPPDVPRALAVGSDGSVVVTGSSALDYGTVKYNSAGVQQWERRHGTSGVIDIPTAIAVDATNAVYVTGTSADNFVTIKYNAAGAQQWLQTYSGSAPGEEGAQSLVLDALGNTYVTGFSQGGVTGLDYATIKYSQPTASLLPVLGAAPIAPALDQNFPNPFNPSTTIRFGLPGTEATESEVRLRVYDSLGRVVASLVDGRLRAGMYEVAWDASRQPSGIYMVKLEADGAPIIRKMVLTK